MKIENLKNLEKFDWQKSDSDYHARLDQHAKVCADGHNRYSGLQSINKEGQSDREQRSPPTVLHHNCLLLDLLQIKQKEIEEAL